MSEQDLEVMEDVDVIETPEDEDLLEFKASMGDPSEVPEPTKTSRNENKSWYDQCNVWRDG
jgi:hypothetical protein